MGKCQVCGTTIDDKYQMCVKCNLAAKQANTGDETTKILKEISEHLKHINWNLGIISGTMTGKKETVKKIQDEMGK